MFSHTYISAAVVVIVQVLSWLGISVGSEELTTTVTTLVTVLGGLYIMWNRLQKGDITVGGTKK